MRPVRRYPLRSITGWIKTMFAIPEFEKLIDRKHPTERWNGAGRWDIWRSGFVSAFLGPAEGEGLYMEQAGNLLFSLAVDWFNPNGNLTAKKMVSVGAIYLICHNLPLGTRYLLENICLLAIIPGPKEPGIH